MGIGDGVRGPVRSVGIAERPGVRSAGVAAGEDLLFGELLLEILVRVVRLVVQAVEHQVEVDASRADEAHVLGAAGAAGGLVDREVRVDGVDQVEDRRARDVDARHRDHAVVRIPRREAADADGHLRLRSLGGRRRVLRRGFDREAEEREDAAEGEEPALFPGSGLRRVRLAVLESRHRGVASRAGSSGADILAAGVGCHQGRISSLTSLPGPRRSPPRGPSG